MTPRILRRRAGAMELFALGFELRRQGKHAYIFAHPCGATASIPLTPSDHRSDRNAVADAHRALRQHANQEDM